MEIDATTIEETETLTHESISIAHAGQSESDSKMQSANAQLRKRFLRFLQWAPNRRMNAQMFGGISLSGQFTAADPTNFEHYLVKDLETPMGLITHAALRTRDTIWLEIPCSKDSLPTKTTGEMEEIDGKQKSGKEEMNQENC